MLTDVNNPDHWLLLARDRLEKVDALYDRFGASWPGIELLHEAVERYLKAYLIAKGWKLIKTHNLELLVVEVMKHDRNFTSFVEMARSLTEQFWLQHYPGGDLADVGSDYDELRQTIGKMVEVVEKEISHNRP